METFKTILENRTAMTLFGVVVLLSSAGYLGIRYVPRHFNDVQINKILKTAEYISLIIGSIPVAIVVFFFLEDLILWGLDKNQGSIFLAMIVICSAAFTAALSFTRARKEFEKKRLYEELDLITKIAVGFALFIGVMGLPSVKALEKHTHHYDFYVEDDQGDEELEELDPE